MLQDVFGMTNTETLLGEIEMEQQCANTVYFLMTKYSSISENYNETKDKEEQDAYLSMMNEIEDDLKYAEKKLNEARKELSNKLREYIEGRF